MFYQHGPFCLLEEVVAAGSLAIAMKEPAICSEIVIIKLVLKIGDIQIYKKIHNLKNICTMQVGVFHFLPPFINIQKGITFTH